MGSVWLTIPSKRPPEETTLHLWRERGYKIALWRDPQDLVSQCPDMQMTGPYSGYAYSVNALIKSVMDHDLDAEWFIAAGDDVEPDLNHTAEEIAAQCAMHFGASMPGCDHCDHSLDTFGVMQATGDRWGDTPRARQMHGEHCGGYIDRVCGSAWIGREFARRVNRGKGPLWPEYFHMYADEELQEVATRADVFWQRRDLIQVHQHWGRGSEGNPNAMVDQEKKMPEFLTKANAGFVEARELFNKRKAAGFPGSEPL